MCLNEISMSTLTQVLLPYMQNTGANQWMGGCFSDSRKWNERNTVSGKGKCGEEENLANSNLYPQQPPKSALSCTASK